MLLIVATAVVNCFLLRLTTCTILICSGSRCFWLQEFHCPFVQLVPNPDLPVCTAGRVIIPAVALCFLLWFHQHQSPRYSRQTKPPRDQPSKETKETWARNGPKVASIWFKINSLPSLPLDVMTANITSDLLWLVLHLLNCWPEPSLKTCPNSKVDKHHVSAEQLFLWRPIVPHPPGPSRESVTWPLKQQGLSGGLLSSWEPMLGQWTLSGANFRTLTCENRRTSSWNCSYPGRDRIHTKLQGKSFFVDEARSCKVPTCVLTLTNHCILAFVLTLGSISEAAWCNEGKPNSG